MKRMFVSGVWPGSSRLIARVGRHRPVVVLARAVDAGERLLVEQALEAVALRHLLQHLHREHVVVGRRAWCARRSARVSNCEGATSLWRVFTGTPSFHSSFSDSCMNARTRGLIEPK
jgi:hypothetical protein